MAAPVVGASTVKAGLGSGGSTTFTTDPITTSARGTYLVGVTAFNGFPIIGVTDSFGNPYSQVQGSVAFTNDPTGSAALFASVSGSGGSNHTFTVTSTGSTSDWTVFVIESPGIGVTLDQTPAGLWTNASPYSSNPAGPTGDPNELLLGFASTYTTSGGVDTIDGSGSGFTLVNAQTNPNGITGATLQRTVSATGTYTLTYTSTGAATIAAITFLVTLKNQAQGFGIPAVAMSYVTA